MLLLIGKTKYNNKILYIFVASVTSVFLLKTEYILKHKYGICNAYKNN